MPTQSSGPHPAPRISAGASTEAAPCTYADHDAITDDALRFMRETDPIGIMPDDRPGHRAMILANCKRCHSTLSRPLPEPSPGEVMAALVAKICAGCGGPAEADSVCAACAPRAEGGRCCRHAQRIDCFCREAWGCPVHGTSHAGTHD